MRMLRRGDEKFEIAIELPDVFIEGDRQVVCDAAPFYQSVLAAFSPAQHLFEFKLLLTN